MWSCWSNGPHHRRLNTFLERRRKGVVGLLFLARAQWWNSVTQSCSVVDPASAQSLPTPSR